MPDRTFVPSCEKCGTPGVPSYLVLSPTLQYWRCPTCFGIWTTRKQTTNDHHRLHNLGVEHLTFGSARTNCPECGAAAVTDLRDVLHSERVDYFRCRACDCWWMVATGQDGPATRVVFGKPDGSANSKKAG